MQRLTNLAHIDTQQNLAPKEKGSAKNYPIMCVPYFVPYQINKNNRKNVWTAHMYTPPPFIPGSLYQFTLSTSFKDTNTLVNLSVSTKSVSTIRLYLTIYDLI